jgi:hypothetical protein
MAAPADETATTAGEPQATATTAEATADEVASVASASVEEGGEVMSTTAPLENPVPLPDGVARGGEASAALACLR